MSGPYRTPGAPMEHDCLMEANGHECTCFDKPDQPRRDLYTRPAPGAEWAFWGATVFCAGAFFAALVTPGMGPFAIVPWLLAFVFFFKWHAIHKKRLLNGWAEWE